MLIKTDIYQSGVVCLFLWSRLVLYVERPAKDPRGTKSAGAVILDFPASRTMRNTCLLFVRCTVRGLCHSSMNRPRRQSGLLCRLKSVPSPVLTVILFLVQEREAPVQVEDERLAFRQKEGGQRFPPVSAAS